MTPMQTYGKMTVANLNYKVSRIFKWHKRFRDGRESLEDDSRSARPVNVKRYNLVESLMDACIHKDTVQHQEMEMTSNVFKQLYLTSISNLPAFCGFCRSQSQQKYEFIRTTCIVQT